MPETQQKLYLITSGDLRLSANQSRWAAQKEMENLLTKAIEAEGWAVVRARHGMPCPYLIAIFSC